MNRSILIIDDKKENLLILEEIISEYLPSCRTIACVGANQGLQSLTPEVDLVISDLQMPQMSGIDLCRIIKARPEYAHIPVLLITAHQSSPSLRVEGMDAGAMDFISRPIDTQELVAKIRVALSIRESEDGLRKERDTLAIRVENTDRKLMMAESRYKTLFESATDAILILSFDAVVQEANSEAHSMLGYKRKALLGLSVSDLLEPGDSCMSIDQIPASGVRTATTNFRRSSGELVPVEVRCRIVDFGDEQAILVIARDVTDKIEYEQALIEAKEKAEIASHSKSQFLANMSHEIRTPLNGIVGMLQLIQMENLEGEVQGFIDQALIASQRLTKLLSDILDLSRVEAGKMFIASVPFDLGETMESMFHLFHSPARHKNLDFEVIADPDLPSRLIGDSARLSQVLGNLIGNAIKFTDEGKITVEARKIKPLAANQVRVLFSVRDTGIGIEEDKIEYLFKQFTQASEGLTRQFQGAGLGLAIARQLVDLMHGSFSVESEVGKGSTFSFAIPFIAVEQEQPGEEDELEPDSRQHYRILLAEDDRITQLATRKLLERMGHIVEVANDGFHAVRQLEHAAFDVVLMDIQMPVMNGMDATQAIRQGKSGEHRKETPIVAMTAYAMAGDKEKFLKAGMNDYLSKPVEVEELQDVLARIF